MFRIPVILFAVFAALVGLGEDRSDSELVASARAILDAYHAENPESVERKLHIVCWRPQDRDFASGYRERIPRIMRHIQTFYADEMERLGFGLRTFQLDYDNEGYLVLHEAVGEGNFADYHKPDGERIKSECWPVLKEAGINPARETVLIFTNLSEWDPEKKTFVHKSPYYARGNFRLGVAWQLDSPELDTTNLSLKEPMIYDGEYGEISLGQHNSIFIGGIAHELGHGLGLPHCTARKDEGEALGTALMGSGNRTYYEQLRGEGKGSFITLAHALRLASHPQFSGSVKGLNLPASARFSEMDVVAHDGGFTISGAVSSGVPVYAVIAYLDPKDRGDYDSTTHSTVPDEDGRFSLKCTAIEAGKPAQVRLYALMANGATSRWSGAYQVTDAGDVDISTMQTQLRLAPLVDALAAGKLSDAEALVEGYEEGTKAHKVAYSVLNASRENSEIYDPGEVTDEVKSYPLSRLRPVEAEVGWGSPVYDRLPGRDALLISGMQIFDTGIYAHAPSRHLFNLDGSKWYSLSGKCGLAENRNGSVVFVVRADGREVYRSPVTGAGDLHAFSIKLRGAKSLELLTEDAGDGVSQDWGVWLGAELKRR
ncbi:MAG: NPCBM/NEW2 domain-containing protein [Verrucomicrobiales bacterium]|nr:NPCBM/NEW2 domain-containing protein [Verrucomicrobiales bacterium]